MTASPPPRLLAPPLHTQLYKVLPGVLLPILPLLLSELHGTLEPQRGAAVALVARLMELPDNDIAEQYPEVLEEFMR